MSDMAVKFGLGASIGNDFTQPWRLIPISDASGNIKAIDSSGAARTAAVVAFHTEMARRGLQDTTNWTADTYKTILSTTGPGRIFCFVGPEAGGSETTTIEITINGVTKTFAIPVTSSQRAVLTAASFNSSAGTMYTTALAALLSGSQVLNAGKTIFTGQVSEGLINPWASVHQQALPCLASIGATPIVVRAKHSASITNSTATAYSSLMYMLGLPT